MNIDRLLRGSNRNRSGRHDKQTLRSMVCPDVVGSLRGNACRLDHAEATLDRLDVCLPARDRSARGCAHCESADRLQLAVGGRGRMDRSTVDQSLPAQFGAVAYRRGVVAGAVHILAVPRTEADSESTLSRGSLRNRTWGQTRMN